MRILLDTNVLVRALFSPDGPAAAVIGLLQPPHEFVCSLAILEEVADVLRRDRVRQLHRRDDTAVSQYLDELRSLAAIVVYETPRARIVPHDPKDDHVITAAVLADADVVATIDRHLRNPDVLAYCQQKGIRVLTDVELLAELRRAGPA